MILLLLLLLFQVATERRVRGAGAGCVIDLVSASVSESAWSAWVRSVDVPCRFSVQVLGASAPKLGCAHKPVYHLKPCLVDGMYLRR